MQSKPLLSDFSFLNFGTEIIQEYVWINSLLSEQLLPITKLGNQTDSDTMVSSLVKLAIRTQEMHRFEL